MNYSDNEDSVRVDFFLSCGKWYSTEAVRWLPSSTSIHAQFEESLLAHLRRPGTNTYRFGGMWAVCLHPSHPRPFPLMIRIPGEP